MVVCDALGEPWWPVAAAVAECRRLGIEILPPDVERSSVDFEPEGNAIRFGLLGVKNVRNYDGSWTEYGSLVGVPVALGDEPGDA